MTGHVFIHRATYYIKLHYHLQSAAYLEYCSCKYIDASSD